MTRSTTSPSSMLKYAVLAFIMGFLPFVVSVISAQEPDRSNAEMATHAEIVRTYLRLSNLSANEVVKALEELSPELRDKLYRFHASLELALRPDLRAKFDEFKLDESINSRRVFTTIQDRNQTVTRMLRKYIDVASMDYENDRKATFRELTIDEKKAIWKVRLALHLTVERFDRQKQQLIIELLSIIDDKPVYVETGRQEMGPIYDSFERRSRAVFGKVDTYRLFMTLGNETTCTSGSRTEGSGTNCTCYYDTPCAIVNEWHLCVTGGCTQVSGCGVIFDTQCTGTCRVPPPPPHDRPVPDVIR